MISCVRVNEENEKKSSIETNYLIEPKPRESTFNTIHQTDSKQLSHISAWISYFASTAWFCEAQIDEVRLGKAPLTVPAFAHISYRSFHCTRHKFAQKIRIWFWVINFKSIIIFYSQLFVYLCVHCECLCTDNFKTNSNPK